MTSAIPTPTRFGVPAPTRLGVFLGAVFGALLALLAVAVPLSSARAEIRVTDVLGREVVLEKPATRVVLGFYFEDFIAIVGPGATDRLAGVSLHYWKGYRPRQYEAYLAKFPAIGDLVDVGDVDNATMSVEKIVAARPDAVILSAGQYDYLGANAAAIEQAGIPLVVVDYNAQTLEKHVASTLVIGQVMGTEDRARRLADAYRAKVEDTRARVAKAATGAKPKVYVELGQKGRDEFGNSYGKGMWAGVVDLAGGANIAAGQVASWGPLNPEYVLSEAPDAIFVTGSEWMSMPHAVLLGFGIDPATTRERLRPYTERAGWADLPAVKNHRVHAIYHGGTRSIHDYVYLRYMAKVLYPEAFADVDPKAELAAYYAENLPIAPAGNFMLPLDE
ncbi:ABC transporter substrate-binding protein [Oharaeibacter diazotrophicus]|uniref:ABC-type Fe3+-hydroxamate transport system substrate-binding protein n=1 Tax=Oharaeibacter diazotrophicus TaxID=1920512 RepID=A0A4R6RH37_9HYPH|nr:ABC transporter substrate-binding protein [Oharaeibacter diazotrophicus]TDP85455.1 ABC-type Fe3+-hydroxamate transport system substrate-binding protein [Oharaeibacter diazotrophicus]BBE74425.1 corrinoid ABC transporter substrate-binding protein [Pleomorphomonas sp. SM30]GLS75879.1 periplasmic binding protein [Oharaeibacter diazotrophicus]